MNSIQDSVRLNNGVRMPVLGLGTWKTASGEIAEQSIHDALELGYRHIDTAAAYGNEESIGKAIRESDVPREQVFITTKLWNTDIRSGNFAQAMETSLDKLEVDYVDLYLIHWPVKDRFVEAWRGLEDLYRQGKARAIGVSNFLVHHLDALAATATVTPAVNQIEFHPWLQSRALVERCRQDGIVVEAWSPLMQGKVGDVPELVEIGERYEKSPAQVALRWCLQHRAVVIPKSVRRERMQENADVFDFDLSPDDMAMIDRLDRGHRFGPDPDNFSF